MTAGRHACDRVIPTHIRHRAQRGTGYLHVSPDHLLLHSGVDHATDDFACLCVRAGGENKQQAQRSRHLEKIFHSSTPP